MTRRNLILCSLLSLPLFSAPPGIDGRWIGTVTLRNGDAIDLEFNFKTSGEKLTGTVTVLLDDPSPNPISEGSVKGTSITFTADKPRGKFNGTLNGDQIDMTIVRGDEDTLRTTLQRSKKS